MNLLCDKVFDEEVCPYPLEKAARKIAKNCEGLPLMIVAVANLLSEAQSRDPQYWEDVAEMRNSVFTDAYDEISKVLFPSYDYLPQHLKMFFLYLGVFPQGYDIPPSKIVRMLTAEGWFVNTYEIQSLEESVNLCLDELCKLHNLVLHNHRRGSTSTNYEVYGFKYSNCRLHSSWRYLCRKEASKNKFFLVLNRLVDGSEEAVKGQRCLCLQNNMLFAIKEFCDLVECNGAFSTHALLFFGPYHQYPIPLHVDFKLLKELDALQLRFYTFPTEILTLFQPKYLALTCNGQLPATISKLYRLRVLIIRPHTNIKCKGDPSYIPVQIWDLADLEHIDILGHSLQAPDQFATLRRLSTLVGVNANIGSVLELATVIPNTRNLGVQIELTPFDDDSDLLSLFSQISTLESLKTLKCSITNPSFKYGYVSPFSTLPSSLIFSDGLRKLHLSGMGFPWEYTDVIGLLPCLEVLKLRSYAFQGPVWETQRTLFRHLEFLLIEDSDLVEWRPSFRSFGELTYLALKHCYKLKELHWPSACHHGNIELVDCNPLALACAKKLRHQGYLPLILTDFSSFDKPLLTSFELTRERS